MAIVNALFRFAQETPRGVHTESDLILGGRNARGALEEAVKVELTHAGPFGQPGEADSSAMCSAIQSVILRSLKPGSDDVPPRKTTGGAT